MYRCFRINRGAAAVRAAAVIIGIAAVFYLGGRAVIRAHAHRTAEAPVLLPVIMYHSVCDRPPADYSVTPKQLEADLEWLSSRGYTAVSAAQLTDYAGGRGELPEKPVMLTFDDGFYNNLSIALPLLKKYGMCAVVSIVGRYTDDYAAADPHADSYSYLTWEDVGKLAASGIVEIGSHTYDLHSCSGGRRGCAKLAGESAEEYCSMLSADTGALRTELHEKCGIEPFVFAYPFGALCSESLPVLRDSGILMTLTCREGMNSIVRDPQCLYGIFRYNRSGLASTADFMERLTGGC